ncbi:MAG TPA: hypothetical protein VMT20_16280 [Terriglobia bacterium]|nr:hypothetical protein [Terriglobia bacterium]
MSAGPVIPRQIARRGTRLGCLGCLVKMLGYLVGFGILGVIFLLALQAVFMPWSFRMGGHFHAIPMWRGWGKMQSASGHNYALYVWFEPYVPSGGRGAAVYSGGPEVVGWGELCTPRGEHYKVRVTGYLPRHMGASTDGERMELDVYRRPWYYGFVGRWDERPRLEFHGAWHNPDLVLFDHGSLDRAFDTDGRLLPANSGVWRSGEQGVQLTLHEGDKAGFEAVCSDI